MNFAKYFLCVFLAFFSCHDAANNNLKQSRNRELQKNKDFFKKLENKWEFYALEFDPIVSENIKNWNEWNNFLKELYFKPRYSLTAFKQKSKDLTTKSMVLSTSLPSFINKYEIETRFIVLHLHIKNLEMYLNLKTIKQEKVFYYLNAVNNDLLVIEQMLNELALKSKIVKEAGEENIVRLKDTTRAANKDIK